MATGGKSLADRLFPIVDEDEELAVVNIPPEKRRLHTETYDFSISTIFNYLEQGTIFVPKFQRDYVWNRSQASRLIESLIIQCPIPVIYLNQEKDEKLAVIDGNQRLTSIRLFLDNEFALQGLTAYPELEGFEFAHLDPRFRRHILNRTLRCITILKETHPQIKIDVFERINTGAVQLNPQEVRHGIYHGPLIDLIDGLAQEKIWKEISGYRNDNRMRGSELILRYFALLIDQESYKKPLKQFLNNFCEKFSMISDAEKLSWKNKFLSSIQAINLLFGKKAFRILDVKLEPTVKNVNAALLDAVMVGFTRTNLNQDELEKVDKADFLKQFQKLLNEPQFRESIESGTSATSSVNHRINRFQKFMDSYFNRS